MNDDIINNGGYNPSNQDNFTSTACGVSFSWKLVNIKSSVVDSGVIFQSANLKY